MLKRKTNLAEEKRKSKDIARARAKQTRLLLVQKCSQRKIKQKAARERERGPQLRHLSWHSGLAAAAAAAVSFPPSQLQMRGRGGKSLVNKSSP